MEVHEQLLAPAAILWDGTSTWVQLEGHEVDVAAQEAVLDRLGSFTPADPVDGSDLPVALPRQRWSLAPASVPTIDPAATGSFVATVGLGLVFAERRQPPRTPDPSIVEVSNRLKQNFDPTGRLNPGRRPGTP
ncbi:MAG: hypothetical protein AAFO29_00115 [Actinomycetota bacterium]